MNNYSKLNGKRIIDRYRGGSVKLYDLCDYINKKAMKWYSLNIEFSLSDVELIKRVQQLMEEMTEIRKDVNNDEDKYDYLDLDYEVYKHDCPNCKGKVKVSRFFVCDLGLNYNIYKCIKCNEEFKDDHPNTIKQSKIYFKDEIKDLNECILDVDFDEAIRETFKQDLLETLELEKKIMNTNNDDILKEREVLKESVLNTINTNGENYKELIKYKHYFDRN